VLSVVPGSLVGRCGLLSAIRLFHRDQHRGDRADPGAKPARKHRPLLLALPPRSTASSTSPSPARATTSSSPRPPTPGGVYAASKMIDEFLVRAYYKEKGLPTVSFYTSSTKEWRT